MQQVLAVPEDANKALPAIVGAIRGIFAAHPHLAFDGIGMCLPGRTDPHLHKLIFAPNLKWPVPSLKAQMKNATGLRVEMDHVANAPVASVDTLPNLDALAPAVLEVRPAAYMEMAAL